MPGRSGAHLFVGRLATGATGVARDHVDHPGNGQEELLDSPEASGRERRQGQALGRVTGLDRRGLGSCPIRISPLPSSSSCPRRRARRSAADRPHLRHGNRPQAWHSGAARAPSHRRAGETRRGRRPLRRPRRAGCRRRRADHAGRRRDLRRRREHVPMRDRPARTTTISPRTSRSAKVTEASDQGSPPHLLVELGELAGHDHAGGRAARVEQIAQGGDQAARRLEQDDGASLAGDGLESGAAGSAPLRGRKPSKQNRSVGSPLTTKAASAALGPGDRTSTVAPGRRGGSRPIDRRDQTPPGCRRRSPRPRCRPAARWARTASTRAISLWPCKRQQRDALEAAWVSKPRVRRVSSQHTRSACARVSTARGDRSPRFPIGVDTRTNVPAATQRSRGS